jgi:hypothetical protein
VTVIVTAHPSCGYAPLQRLATNRCIALLVRRSRPRIQNSKEPCAFRYSSRSARHSAEAKQLLSCGCAHYRVQPNVARRPRSSFCSEEQKKPTRSATLMEFLPLRRMSPSESTPRRLATPATFRPQGFSPSRRIPPRSDARPCFMPVTPMGFRSPGAFPHCQVLRLVTEELPSWRFSSALLSKLHNPGRPISATLHQGSPRHEPLPPSGPCSDSESVPPLDCYIRCERPIPS